MVWPQRMLTIIVHPQHKMYCSAVRERIKKKKNYNNCQLFRGTIYSATATAVKKKKKKPKPRPKQKRNSQFVIFDLFSTIVAECCWVNYSNWTAGLRSVANGDPTARAYNQLGKQYHSSTSSTSSTSSATQYAHAQRKTAPTGIHNKNASFPIITALRLANGDHYCAICRACLWYLWGQCTYCYAPLGMALATFHKSQRKRKRR